MNKRYIKQDVVEQMLIDAKAKDSSSKLEEITNEYHKLLLDATTMTMFNDANNKGYDAIVAYNAKERLVAEIVTVKDLLQQSINVDDILGTNSMKSRLKALEKELNNLKFQDLLKKANSRYSPYSDEHDEKHEDAQ